MPPAHLTIKSNLEVQSVTLLLQYNDTLIKKWALFHYSKKMMSVQKA